MSTPAEGSRIHSSAMPVEERLANQLQECANLVRKGDRGNPLLKKTARDLTDYLTSVNGVKESRVKSSGNQQQQQQSRRPSGSKKHHHKSSGAPHSPKQSPKLSVEAKEAVTKPQKPPPHLGQVLGKIVGMGGEVGQEPQARSEASKKATSLKNASRIKEELAAQQKQSGGGGAASWLGSVLGGSHEEPEWCEEHFTMGCACKTRRHADEPDNVTSSTTSKAKAQTAQSKTITTTTADGKKVVRTVTTTTVPSGSTAPRTAAPPAASSAASVSSAQSASAGGNAARAKPAFQRPVNPKTPLIANGWIEQQRRSKMRTVWKDVLASLVEGRRPGEETTLWIQREITNPATGKPELEALHQIPVKWLEQIHYQEYSTDNRFSLKVFNLNDEFIFRCNDDNEAAQNWVLTLRSVQQITQRSRKTERTGVDEWDKTAARSSPVTTQQTRSFEEEKKLPDSQQQEQSQSHRMSVKELRAIAHGAGIATHGMERGELERIVANIAAGGAGPTGAPAGAEESAATTKAAEEERRRQHQEELQRRMNLEEARKRQAEEAERKQKEAEEERQRMLAERVREQRVLEQKRREEEERQKEEQRQRLIAERVKEQQALEQKNREEAERRRLEEERLRRDEEEIRRRAAERQAAEQRRKQEEAQRLQQQQWQQQQQAWQQKQAEDEQRRRAAEMQAAEARRQQEEALRRQQQWQQQQQRPPGPYPQPGFHPQNAHFPGAAPYPQQQAHGAHPGYHPQANVQYPGATQPPHATHQVPPQNMHHAPPAPPPNASPINNKYAKMAQQSDEGGEAMITNIKHGILIQWALLPPMLQVLRPIEDLLTSIHTVFPPKFGVPGHQYFSKWAAVKYEDISQGPALGNRPDDIKLKKVMRKLRFFLHPDKLPRDLSKEQSFMCKMLWDVISDAEAEHKKREEELGWIRS